MRFETNLSNIDDHEVLIAVPQSAATKVELQRLRTFLGNHDSQHVYPTFDVVDGHAVLNGLEIINSEVARRLDQVLHGPDPGVEQDYRGYKFNLGAEETAQLLRKLPPIGRALAQ